MWIGRPDASWTRWSSESSLKRLHAASMASSSAASSRWAVSATPGSRTTTVAVVPMARKDRDVNPVVGMGDAGHRECRPRSPTASRC